MSSAILLGKFKKMLTRKEKKLASREMENGWREEPKEMSTTRAIPGYYSLFVTQSGC